VKKTIRQIELSKIKTDPVGDDLTKSPEMKPYVDVIVALMKKEGVKEAVQRVADLNLNERYVWRVASALDLAFADLDSESALLDWEVMSDDERAEISEMLRLRVIQFAYFLRALYGKEELTRRFNEALSHASDL
jgi:phage tail sheath protein FI